MASLFLTVANKIAEIINEVYDDTAVVTYQEQIAREDIDDEILCRVVPVSQEQSPYHFKSVTQSQQTYNLIVYGAANTDALRDAVMERAENIVDIIRDEGALPDLTAAAFDGAQPVTIEHDKTDIASSSMMIVTVGLQYKVQPI